MRQTMKLKTIMEKMSEHKPTAPQDVETVVEPVKEFFGVDEDEAAEKLSDYSIDDNLDLIDSVRRGDKDEVIDLLGESKIGDEVTVGGEDGVIKITNGPGDTVGVLINGELKMVNKSDLNENVIGVNTLPSLTRMLELAGMKKPEGEEEAKAEDAPAEAQPEAPAAEAPQAAPAAESPEGAPAVAEVEITQAAAAPAAGAYEPMELPAECHGVEVDTQVAPAEVINDALSALETALPQLTIAEFKAIRDRLNKLNQVVYENAMGRPRKLV